MAAEKIRRHNRKTTENANSVHVTHLREVLETTGQHVKSVVNRHPRSRKTKIQALQIKKIIKSMKSMRQTTMTITLAWFPSGTRREEQHERRICKNTYDIDLLLIDECTIVGINE